MTLENTISKKSPSGSVYHKVLLRDTLKSEPKWKKEVKNYERKAKTYGEETIEDIISELNDLHRQEQILLNRLEYKLKTMKGELK